VGEGGIFNAFLGFETEVARTRVRNTGRGRCHFGSAIGCEGQGMGRFLPQDTSVRVAENVLGAIRCSTSPVEWPDTSHWPLTYTSG
jgi:hypothetical protein